MKNMLKIIFLVPFFRAALIIVSCANYQMKPMNMDTNEYTGTSIRDLYLSWGEPNEKSGNQIYGSSIYYRDGFRYEFATMKGEVTDMKSKRIVEK